MSNSVLNEDEMRRLKELNAKIDSLREQLKSEELKRSKLMEKFYNSEHEVIDALPGYLQNGLRILKITTDYELIRYLDGGFELEDFKASRINEYYYLYRAKTRKERLMLFRGVGEKTATEALKIIEEKGL